jgi:hypothetical protein
MVYKKAPNLDQTVNELDMQLDTSIEGEIDDQTVNELDMQLDTSIEGEIDDQTPLIHMDALDMSSTSDNNNQMSNESDEWSYSDCHFDYEHENEEIFPFPEECEAFSNDCGECYTHEKCFFWTRKIYRFNPIETTMTLMLIQLEVNEQVPSG